MTAYARVNAASAFANGSPLVLYSKNIIQNITVTYFIQSAKVSNWMNTVP